MKNILIFGATSAIAQATAQRYAAQGARFYLLARNAAKLAAMAADLETRGAQFVEYDTFDAADLDQLPQYVADGLEALGSFDIVLLAHARRASLEAQESPNDALLNTFEVNTLSTIVLLEALARICEHHHYGTLAVLSSVAADFPHRSNGAYAASKAALDSYLQSLRHRLHPYGVRVVTLKPGFIDTPLTAGFHKGVLWRTPEAIAPGIVRAIEQGRNVAYLPGWWRLIGSLLRHIPEALRKRLSV